MDITQVFHVIMSLLLIIGMESVLSFDNIAVLSLIVNKNLPPEQRQRALKYGMIGAFVFRGLSLLFVSWILHNPEFGAVFKALGGLYLVRLGYKGLTPKEDSIEEGEVGWADKLFKVLKISTFWSTVIICEAVDYVFSLDNLVAVVGLSDNINIVIIGVIVGIITMRFIATKFIKLMEKYPSLEISAYIVILLLGIKLVLSGVVDYFPSLVGVKHVLESHVFDFAFSGAMMAIFFIPMLIKRKNG